MAQNRQEQQGGDGWWYWHSGKKIKDKQNIMERPQKPKAYIERRTRVYLWWIHVDIWQNQYNIVKLINK